MILTLVETDLEGAAIEVSLEAVTFARDLSAAGNGVPVDAVVIGDVSDHLRGELAAYGVRKIHRVSGDGVAAYSGAGWASALQTVLKAAGSVVLMAAGTDRGTELMAHVAARSGASMAANVLSFSGLSPFVVTRQVVGGAAMEEMNLHQRPAVFTVAGHAVEAKPADASGAGEIVEHTPTVAPEDLRAAVVSTSQPEADESGDLTSAKVVVGAGRGVGGADKFDDVVALADLLGGAIGVSRVVTSAGWRPHHEQVGQTGSRISPDLYIPCGISGAIQHWAGCS
jgi:electron transfer flavoprotein alpha subunit